jgi:asparagine synthase (glutamine-hydrolysing)
MSRIIGFLCQDNRCSTEQHHFQVKEASARYERTEIRALQILAIQPLCPEWARSTPTLLDGKALSPVYDETRRWCLAYDGLLYNASTLREELRSRGYYFHSATDTEVILKAFAEWGADGIRRLSGMFAFALYDREGEILYLARDIFGLKPLYYAPTPRHVWFASELPTLTRALPTKSLNKLRFLEWMVYQHLATRETFFLDVYALQPGHLVMIHGNHIEDRAYASFIDYIDPDLYKHYQTAPQEAVIAEAEAALTSSVQECLAGNDAVGTFCSGGVDSSLITAIASQSIPHLRAFHASAVDSARCDERRYAESVATALRVELISSPIDQQLFQRQLAHVIALNGMPLAHIHLVPFYLVVQNAYAHGIRVLLTGDAADDHFGGLWYRHRRQPLLQLVTRLFGRLPRRLRNALALGANLYGGMPYTLVGAEGVIPHVLSAIDGFGRAETRLRCERTYAFISEELSRAILATMAEDLTERWDLDRADRLGMAAGVECRAPFVHPVVVRLALNLPLRYRFRRWTDKWLLKKIEARYIPRKLVYCKKRPWDLPWKEYLAPLARQTVFHRGFCSEGLGLSAAALDTFIASWDTNTRVFWNLLNLELWGRLCFMDESVEQVTALLSVPHA